MNLSVGAKTDPGRRPNNEDQLLVLDVRRHHLRADGVLVIADGMGGRNFGERASAAAVETVGDSLSEMLDAERDPVVDVGDALSSALRKANSRVYELAGSDEESRGMGTTCVAAVVEGERVYVAHAGDSRAYRWRKGQLQRLTDDHSYVAEQVRAGVLTEENARRSRFRNVITRAVGIEPTITPDVSEHDLETGDALLLCTDGLTNMVAEEEIAETLGQAQTAQAAADRLVHLANVNGGRDNITAIVARMEVGTRTQRMRTNDLAQTAPPDVDPAPRPPSRKTPDAQGRNGDRRNAGAPTGPAEDETPTVQPTRRPPVPAPAPAPMPSPVPAEHAAAAETGFGEIHPRRARRGRPGVFLASLLTLLCALLLAATVTFGKILSRAGYRFQTAPPFAVKPVPPPPPKPPDLAHVQYGAPRLVSAVPVSGDVLTHGTDDGSLTVVSLSGSVLVLTTDGRMLYKYSMPKRHLPPPITTAAAVLKRTVRARRLPKPVIPPPVVLIPRLHTATDVQGDLYLSDSVLRTIEKYTRNGEFLRYVVQNPGELKQPQALAIGGDGTVYVVDAQRLKAIPATPPAGATGTK